MIQVVYAHLVAALEAATISLAVTLRQVRMPKLFTIVYIRTAMVAVVFTCSLNAIMKTMTLNIIEFGRRCIPVMLLNITRRRHKASSPRRYSANSKKTYTRYSSSPNPNRVLHRSSCDRPQASLSFSLIVHAEQTHVQHTYCIGSEPRVKPRFAKVNNGCYLVTSREGVRLRSASVLTGEVLEQDAAQELHARQAAIPDAVEAQAQAEIQSLALEQVATLYAASA